MANRRMIANSIILSDKFLDLSKDAKLLWFYVVGGADDDGLLLPGRLVPELTCSVVSMLPKIMSTALV